VRNLLVAATFIGLAASASAAVAEVYPPSNARAADVPNDGGGAIEVSWEPSPSREIAGYRLTRFSEGAPDGELVAELPPVDTAFTDDAESESPPVDGTPYSYEVSAISPDGEIAGAPRTAQVTSSPSWIHAGRIANLAALLVFVAMFFVLVYRGKRGKPLFIRPIDALDDMDDAVGRAAEMGQPVFYAPGLHSITQPATVASVSLLRRVAERSARLHTPVKVPNYDPLTWPVAQEVVRQAFDRAGRPEEFNPDDISYLTSRSFTYAAAVAGIMVRERTASNFLIGHFYSESLILAETGVSTGALQIGGTDSVAQLPFFITTCDRTMIGEELFAAAALVGDDPVSRSTVKAHDWFKALIMAMILGGAAACALADTGILESLLDLFGVNDPAQAAASVIGWVRGGLR